MSRHVGERLNHIKQIIQELDIHQSNSSSNDVLTRQYGFIKFTDNDLDESTRLSQYIRLALKTNAGTVVKFMKEAWGLRTPDLIISITGGAKYSELSARLRKAFQVGLVSAAATTNAWILTAGTNAGVVKEAGEALNKYRYKNQVDGLDIPCIGIASWGYTAENYQLDRSVSINTDGRPNMGVSAIQMSGEAVYGIQTYVVKSRERGQCDLEPNHTHFLLFDDGETSPDHVLPLRADIEMHLRHANIGETIEGAVQTLIPIVMILVEGGRASIQTVCKALKSNTPVVVVKESGRAADLVANLHACFSKDKIDDLTDNNVSNSHKHTRRSKFNRASLRVTKVNAIFTRARINNPWVNDIREELIAALTERRSLITIFNFGHERHHGKLEEAILEAVFNAAKLSNQDDEQYQSAAELRLALAWHNVEYARRAIFTDKMVLNWKDEDLRQGLVDALRRGYSDFIELFIEYGITLEKLTIQDLEHLYFTASKDKVLPLKKISNDPLTREEFYNDYIKKYLKNNLKEYTDKSVPLDDYAIRDLFFWAIFLDRFDFSMYLCSKTWNQSVALLFGARIYRKAAKMTLDSETKQQYESNAHKFDKYSASLIDRCFENDRDFALHIIQKESPAFYNLTPLQLAAKANCRAFLASKCVQRYLDNQWFGNINYKRQNINFRIFLCSLFFPLLPIFCYTLPYLRRHQPFNPNAGVNFKNQNSFTNSSSGSNIEWTEKIRYFYRAPIVRFYYNLTFFFIFLALFSYVILVDYFPLNTHHGTRSGIENLPLPITEISLHILVWGLILEEIHQFLIMYSSDDYFDEVSNLYDIAAIAMYLIGFITRFIPTETFFTISKIVFGLDLILWYIRILHLFAAYERLGPKLIMIFKTMKDLLFFVYFILIFLFGFSITSWSLITTSSQVKWTYDHSGRLINITIAENNTNEISWKLLRDITNYGIWKVFGQVEIIDSDNSYSAAAFILAILFVAISNVLLLNVLVALFNVTIQNVQHQSHDLWRYQRFLLVTEYEKKNFLPPPFNAINYLLSMIRDLIKLCRKPYGNYKIFYRNRRATRIGTLHNPTDRHFKITDEMKRESAIAEDFWRDLLKQIEEKTK